MFVALSVTAGLLALPTQAGAVGRGAKQSAVVSAVPFADTPNITDGITYAVTQVGSLTLVGGSFTGVQDHGSSTTVTRNRVLAFNSKTGKLSSTFVPVLDGTVEALEPGPTANTVYVGGFFNTVNGHVSKGVTLLSTKNGDIVSGFSPPALNGAVYTIVSMAKRVLIGGAFTMAGSSARGGLASLNRTTGALGAFAANTFAGHHNYNGSGAEGSVGPRAMAVNSSATRLMVIGNFKTVDGLARDQIAMIDLDHARATVDPHWATAGFSAPCTTANFDTYVTDVQYSPNGAYFAVTATGGNGGNNSDGSRPLCDSVSRWDASATGSDVTPAWIDYTGNDTLWSVATTGTAIYVGGHERWLNNPNAYDQAGAGAVPRPGIAALDPRNGLPLIWNPGRNPRGDGAYALYASPTGLYVGSDTDYIGNRKYKHQKIAYFPLAGGVTPAPYTTASLPANLYLAGLLSGSKISKSVDDLDYRSIKGSKVGATKTVPKTGVAWSQTRGAFMIYHSIFYPTTAGNFYRAKFNGKTVGKPALLDPYDNPTWDSVPTGSEGTTYQGVKSSFYDSISSITGAFYSAGKIYYTLSGNSALQFRYFTPGSGTIGGSAYAIAAGDFSNIDGMVLSGKTLYYASGTDGKLHSESFANGFPNPSSDTIVPGSGGKDWRAHGMFLFK